jgi:hypothetical protein
MSLGGKALLTGFVAFFANKSLNPVIDFRAI